MYEWLEGIRNKFTKEEVIMILIITLSLIFYFIGGVIALTRWDKVNFAFLGFLIINLVIIVCNGNIKEIIKNITIRYKDYIISFQNSKELIEQKIKEELKPLEERISKLEIETKTGESPEPKMELFKQ